MTEYDSITDLVPTQKYHKTLYAFARRMISASQRTGMLKGCSLIGPIAFTIYFVVVTSTNVTSPMQRNLSLIYKGELEHKNLIPLNDSDIIGSLFVILGLMMAASGGIGGGGILVPLLIIIFEFNPKHAVPLSNFTILGSSVTNILMNLSKRHPNADRPLIDWDMILVMEPLTMAGAVSLYLILFTFIIHLAETKVHNLVQILFLIIFVSSNVIFRLLGHLWEK